MNVIRLDKNQPPSGAPQQPIPGFDVLRALAALAVVVLHAGVPYLRHPMPGLIWSVTDSPSRVVDAIFWGIEVMIMPLFLVITGFLMWRSRGRYTPGQLVKSRARRLLAPLAFGCVIILPIDLYLWTIGLVSEGVVPVVKLKSFKFDSPISQQIWGTSHLWFLMYVFLYVVVTALLLRLADRKHFRRLSEMITRPKVLLVLLPAVAVATLAAVPEVVWGFQHAFLPVPSKWIYSGMFFAAGCALAGHDSELKWVALNAPRMLPLAAVLMVSSVVIGIWSLDQSDSGTDPNVTSTLLLALLTVAAASTTTIGLIGAIARSVRRVPEAVRYVASASFWIYLVHHPLLGLVHYDIKLFWPTGQPIVKLCVSFCVATGVSLLMFESMVRRTWLGSLLGFSHLSAAKMDQSHDGAADILKLPSVEPETRRAA